jgi:CspA family cold shock protein
VKWFNADMGYGFIQPDDDGPEVFVHVRAVERAGMFDLTQGQKLTFEVIIDKDSGKAAAYDLSDA